MFSPNGGSFSVIRNADQAAHSSHPRQPGRVSDYLVPALSFRTNLHLKGRRLWPEPPPATHQLRRFGTRNEERGVKTLISFLAIRISWKWGDVRQASLYAWYNEVA
jgi:hypothetical protein